MDEKTPKICENCKHLIKTEYGNVKIKSYDCEKGIEQNDYKTLQEKSSMWREWHKITKCNKKEDKNGE